MIFCSGKTKYCLVLTGQKIIPKQNLLRFVLVLPKQKIIVQVRLNCVRKRSYLLQCHQHNVTTLLSTLHTAVIDNDKESWLQQLAKNSTYEKWHAIVRQLRGDVVLAAALRHSCIGVSANNASAQQVEASVKQTLTKLFQPLTNLASRVHFPACIDYKRFNPNQVDREVAIFQLSGQFSEQATALYNFLAHKYCFHYWFVQIFDSSHDEWWAHGRGYFVEFAKGNSAFGAAFHSVHSKEILIAWSNSLRDRSEWSEYRRDFADAMLNATNATVQSQCGGDDQWTCRIKLADENVESKFNWSTPLSSGYTLHQRTSIAYRYAPGFAFVHRGQTKNVDDNSGPRRGYAPPGVSLTKMQALVMTTMSDCPRSDIGECAHSSWMQNKNATLAPPATIDCAGFTCTGLADDE